MVSRSRVRSSMAASQFCMRISEASFPHRELKALRSVEGTWKRQEIEASNEEIKKKFSSIVARIF